MAIVYKTTDRIKVKIGDVIFKVAPLTREHKVEVLKCNINNKGDSLTLIEEMTFKLVQFTIKEVVSGIQNLDGSNYKLEFENGILTDDCANDLMNLKFGGEIRMVAQQMAQGVPDEFTDNETGEVLKGVKIISENKVRKKR